MPVLHTVKVYNWVSRDQMAAIFEPGEHLLAVGNYHQPFNGDESKLELEDHELPDDEREYLEKHGRRMPRSDKFIDSVDLCGIHPNPDRIKRMISGLAGKGAPDSVAGRLWRISRTKGFDGTWAVTNRRFLVWDEHGFDPGADKKWTILFEVRREQIARVRRPFGLLFEWARVEITFTDDSMIGINAAIFDVIAAHQFRRALKR